ncbi:serine hydrolase domain-containing protein [Sphingomonas sp. G-3-2-10]|uniref:serine hydrolase domain-containing protein n=1 Tax=Sphingomonas sp. G-3-2-10 TaxID=2728838 RepID=UPI00146AFBA6|nr:serine hydrolase domain-containing protein [Sphingomonas sp. G-3-2-10]NML08422.1 beta-lactamase family protein [Sphingomonas sp. G-3-2-10]
MVAVHGSHDAAFARIARLFADSFEPSPDRPHERGAALSVFVNGMPMVDLWAGEAREGVAWTADSAPCVFSCTKGILATLFHIVAQERGVDYDAPVARWWPEFAGGGKEAITVRQLLAHQAGLTSLADAPEGDPLAWQPVCDALAAQPASRPPESPHGYHSLTFGWLVGELLLRIAGEPLDVLLDTRINRPAGAAFAWRGSDLSPGAIADLNAFEDQPRWATGGDAILADIASIDDPRILLPAVANSRGWRGNYILGAGGHASARSLARIYAALIGGDSPLLPPGIVRDIASERGRGLDSRLQVESAYASGYQLPAAGITLGSRNSGDRPFGHKGAYGSAGLADPEAGLAFGYVTNVCAGAGDTSRNGPLLDAIYECL